MSAYDMLQILEMCTRIRRAGAGGLWKSCDLWDARITAGAGKAAKRQKAEPKPRLP